MKLRIVCIDDSKSIHAFLRDCLREITSEFTSAYDGVEGLDLITSKRIQFDCVFLDWEMPNKTGPEVLVEARAKGVNQPIIMLTSKNQPDEIAKMLEEGATEYIMKPFTKDIILERINMVLGESGEI